MQRHPSQVAARKIDCQTVAATITRQLVSESAQKHYTWLPDSVRLLAGNSPLESQVFLEVYKQLLDSFTLENAPLNIPSSIGHLYDRELERIKKLIDTGDQASLRFDLDVRQKDIAILTFRFIPVGAEFAEPWSAIWKRQVLTARANQFFKATNYFLLKRNGFYPYFQLHMHQQSNEDFNQAGWTKTYMRLAELLECNPGHRGWFSSSWLVDPALEKISPHLSYLRTVPESNGGAIFYMEDDPEGKTGALLTSRTRRRMFESGRYHPRIYLRVWPRSAAIAWWKAQAGKSLS